MASLQRRLHQKEMSGQHRVVGPLFGNQFLGQKRKLSVGCDLGRSLLKGCSLRVSIQDSRQLRPGWDLASHSVDVLRQPTWVMKLCQRLLYRTWDVFLQGQGKGDRVESWAISTSQGLVFMTNRSLNMNEVVGNIYVCKYINEKSC